MFLSINLSIDGEVDVVFVGGLFVYIISWMGLVSGSMMVNILGFYNINGLSVGSYIVMIEDSNGCIEICIFVFIEVGVCIFDLIINMIDEICLGEMDGIVVVVFGGGIFLYMYIWSMIEIIDMISGLLLDDYIVMVMDVNNCIVIVNFIIGIVNVLLILVVGSGVVICVDSCYSLFLMLSG